MDAIRGEPVEVWPRRGKPARFSWRGRIYTILLVLDRRVVPDSRQNPAPAGGRECWLVEATPGRGVPASTFELCREVAADRWTVSRS